MPTSAAEGKCLFIPSSSLGSVLEAKARALEAGDLHQRRRNTKRLAQLLAALELVPAAAGVVAIGWGCSIHGAPGVIIAFDVTKVFGQVAP